MRDSPQKGAAANNYPWTEVHGLLSPPSAAGAFDKVAAPPAGLWNYHRAMAAWLFAKFGY
jgi:hypothetical protein